MGAELHVSEQYVVWYEPSGEGLLELDDGSAWDSKYYFYDRSSDALYCICGDKDKRADVFSEWFSDYLYFNCTYGGVDNTLFVFDPASGKVWQQKLEGIGMQFSEYGSGQVCLEVRTDEEAKLFTIQVPR